MKESKASFVRENVEKEITKQVVWRKFARQRHCIIEKGIDPAYLDTVFPRMLPLFKPQHVVYNGGIANVKDWKISCYLEVMDGGVPTTEPNLPLLDVFSPLLDSLNQIFLHWYRQQHNRERIDSCRRLMTFITRYTSNPGEEALLKVRCASLACMARLPHVLTLSYGSTWTAPAKWMDLLSWPCRSIAGPLP